MDEDIRVAAEELVRQIEQCGAVDDSGNDLKQLKPFRDLKNLFAARADHMRKLAGIETSDRWSFRDYGCRLREPENSND